MASSIAIFWRPTTPIATAGGILHGDGTGYKITPAGTSGQPLLSAGAADPAFGQLDPTVGILNGATGTGAVVLQNSPTLTGSPLTPTQASTDNSTKIASTAYVTTAITNAIAAVNPAVAVQAATAAILPNSPTYLNGVSGIGATITAGVTNTTLVVDGYTPLLNDRILVKNEAGGGGLGASRNGIYTVTQLAALGLAWILTRALDYDQPSDMNNTGAIPVVNGTANTQTQWVLTSTVNMVGTDAVTFTQFSSNPSKVFTTAGSNLSGTGSNTVAYAPTVVTDNSTGTQANYNPGISGNTTHFWAGASDITVQGLTGGVLGFTYTFRNTGTHNAFFAHNNGAASAGNKLFNIVTSGLTAVAPGGRISYTYDGTQWQLVDHEQGAFITHTFNAGDFTADNGATWTVTSGEVNEHSYRLSGRQLFVKFHFGTVGSPTQITVAAANNLFWVIAGGYTCVGGTVLTSAGIINDGTQVDAYIQYANASTQITFSKIAVAQIPIGSVRAFGSFFCEVS